MKMNLPLDPLKRVLLKHGFHYVRNNDQIYFIKHDPKLGGIYAQLDLQQGAKLRFQGSGFLKNFPSRKSLDNFLNSIEDKIDLMPTKMIRILERDRIRNILAEIYVDQKSNGKEKEQVLRLR